MLTPPRCTSYESFSSCCDSVAALALFFHSVAALALASCIEHVAEAIFLRPHPPTPRVLCTVPTQSSKLERSEKQLNCLVRETCAHYMHFLVPGPNCHTEFLTFSLLRALFLPHAASGGKYLPRAVLSNLEPGVIDAVRASSLGCLIRPGINLVGKTGLKTTTKELSTNSSAPPIPNFRSLHLSSVHVLTQAQRARVNFYPLHSPLCHFGLH